MKLVSHSIFNTIIPLKVLMALSYCIGLLWVLRKVKLLTIFPETRLTIEERTYVFVLRHRTDSTPNYTLLIKAAVEECSVLKIDGLHLYDTMGIAMSDAFVHGNKQSLKEKIGSTILV